MTSQDSTPTDDLTDDPVTSGRSGVLRIAIEIAVAALILAGIYYLFAPEEEIDLSPPLQESEIDPIIRAQIEAAGQQPEQPDEVASSAGTEPLQTGTGTAEPAPPPVMTTRSAMQPSGSLSEKVSVEDAIPQDGRGLVSRLRDGSLRLDSDQLMQRALSFQSAGQLTDAYLLLFYAAREGDGQAAFALASLYDPDYFQAGNELLESADVYQAHKWYQEAEKQRIPEARQRLQRLRSHIEKQAQNGDPSAQRLLLNWQ
ncbi:MAG: hypothetical protein ABW076_06920 [Candidatus Thiodiazotropha sp.]